MAMSKGDQTLAGIVVLVVIAFAAAKLFPDAEPEKKASSDTASEPVPVPTVQIPSVDMPSPDSPTGAMQPPSTLGIGADASVSDGATPTSAADQNGAPGNAATGANAEGKQDTKQPGNREKEQNEPGGKEIAQTANAGQATPPIPAIKPLSGEVVFPGKFRPAAIRPHSIDRKAIRSLLQQARACTGKIRVTGHTDGMGKEQRNEELSRRRASVVKGMLVKAGIPANRIHVVGAGAGQPLSENNTQRGRDQNRRVEVACE